MFLRHLFSFFLSARLWDLHTYSNLVAYKGHNSPVWDVDFSPSGYYFATASRDRTARLWATDNPQPLRIFSGHLSDVEVYRVLFSLLRDFIFVVSFSASSFILMGIMWQPALWIVRASCGISSLVVLYAFLRDTR